MPTIEFEGAQYEFPEDVTEDEIQATLTSLPVEEEAPKAAAKEPLREQKVIRKDEGVKRNKEGKHIAYADSEKRQTGGIGHLLTKEEMSTYPEGTAIPQKVVDTWFKQDMIEADETLTRILEEKATHVPDEVYDILLNMAFNMGEEGLEGFTDMWAAIEVEDWATVAKEMKDSEWAGQVKSRATRLINRMQALAPETAEAEQAPTKGGLFEDENGKLWMVDDQGNKREV